jgi:uncharacterized protein (TIGR01777 family)
MRIVITGGTGMIGRSLAANLAPDGHEVVLLSRTPERATDLPTGVRAEKWDARTGEGWAHLADGAGAIVNLAGASIAGEGFFPRRWTPERKALIRDSRIKAGHAVVDAISRVGQKPRVVIQQSGIGYYGPSDDSWLTEDAPPGTDFGARLASNEWETATMAVEEMGVRHVIARTAPVFDEREGALPRMLLPFRLFVGGPMGSGRQWLSWIHRDDSARATRFLIENEKATGPFNVSSPNPVTYGELAKIIGRVMRRPSFMPIPGFAMKLAFGEVSNVLLEGQRATPQRLLDMGFDFRFPTAEAALRDLLA